MKRCRLPVLLSRLALVGLLVAASGCKQWKMFYEHPSAVPLGTISDAVWQNEETNAELADFIVFQHEFERDTEYLNTAGEDHVRQIAARLMQGQDGMVVVERGMMAPREETRYQYPVHPDPELDLRRREIIVRSLAAMGVPDAADRVAVAPSFAEGYSAQEAERSYHRGMSARGGQMGGGMGGGFMGGGFF